MTAIQDSLKGGGVIYFYINVELISVGSYNDNIMQESRFELWTPNFFIFKMCKLQPLSYLIKKKRSIICALTCQISLVCSFMQCLVEVMHGIASRDKCVKSRVKSLREREREGERETI